MKHPSENAIDFINQTFKIWLLNFQFFQKVLQIKHGEQTLSLPDDIIPISNINVTKVLTLKTVILKGISIG